MKRNTSRSRKAAADETLHLDGKEHYVLRLFVTGTTKRSLSAITNLKRICDVHLDGRYDLEVIDVYQNSVLARTEQIIAAPTLIKVLPLPLRRLIGNLADTDRTLLGLGLNPFKTAGHE